MPIERQSWRPVFSWDALTAIMRRAFEVFTTSDRVDVQSMSASANLALTWPLSLVLVDTSGGNVTVTLPNPQTVPGFRVEVKKMTAANTLTVASAANIDGSGTLATTTQYDSTSFVSTSSTWVIV